MKAIEQYFHVVLFIMLQKVVLTLKVHMTDISICSIKPPQSTDKKSKIKFNRDFSSSCFDVPKTRNFTSCGVQNRKLGMIVTSF